MHLKFPGVCDETLPVLDSARHGVTPGVPEELGQERQKVIIDQDDAGPAGTDLQSMLLLIQSPQTQVLGITVVTGDMWLDEELAHTLRMLELIGRTDIPVVARR